jgi:hypothetical protein
MGVLEFPQKRKKKTKQKKEKRMEILACITTGENYGFAFLTIQGWVQSTNYKFWNSSPELIPRAFILYFFGGLFPAFQSGQHIHHM